LKFLGLNSDNSVSNFKVVNKNKSYKSKFIRNFIKKYSVKLGKLRYKFMNKPLGIIKAIENLNKKETNRSPMSDGLKNSLVDKFSKVDTALKEIINNY
jgi:hypothetical protein